MEKKIEEMRELIHNEIKKAVDNGLITWTEFAQYLTERLTKQGYLKQAEGHWITHDDSYECSECGEEIEVDNPEDYDPVSDYDFRFCYHCGAKMKGAEDEKAD